MKSILYFSNLADAVLENEPALQDLQNASNVGEVYCVLQKHKMVDISLEDYLILALQAGDDIKRYLDPDTGEISEDAFRS